MKFAPALFSVLLPHLTILQAEAGPFPPAAGTEGTTAIPMGSTDIVAWADRVVSYAPGTHLDPVWTNESRALGPASLSVFEVVSLGRGGSITLLFDPPIVNDEGWDFAVFENAFSDTFLELAFVEISSDGAEYYRFSTLSLTSSPVGPFGLVDVTDTAGFAGRYRAGYGSPFDIEESGLSSVSYIRIVDAIGDGSTTDSGGNPIFDPFPTIGSAGFDLDAVGVRYMDTGDSGPNIGGNGSEDTDGDGFSALLEYALGMDPGTPDRREGAPEALPGGGLEFPYLSNLTDLRYVVEGSDDLNSWRELAEGNAGLAFAALEDGVTVTQNANDPSRIEVRTDDHRFLRLKVFRYED